MRPTLTIAVILILVVAAMAAILIAGVARPSGAKSTSSSNSATSGSETDFVTTPTSSGADSMPNSTTPQASSGVSDEQSVTSSTTVMATSTLTITETAESTTETTASCPGGDNSSSVSTGGLTLLTCFSALAKVGGVITLEGVLLNVNSTVRAQVSFSDMNITNSEGNTVFYQQVFPSLQVSLSPGESYTLITTWNTGAQNNGIQITAGEYTLQLVIGDVSSQTTLVLSN